MSLLVEPKAVDVIYLLITLGNHIINYYLFLQQIEELLVEIFYGNYYVNVGKLHLM